jgi:hypothetical protein
MMRDKGLFISLCAAVWFINICMTDMPVPGDIWRGLAVSLVSIPAWALIGSVFAAIAVFFFRLARIDTAGLTLWQKADVGLAMAVVLKPALGIPF